jgi:methionine sulfoxide reductase heme-binding subunit
MPMTDRINAGLRRVPIWPLYIIGALPPFWYLYLGLTGGLGAEPISALEHRLGLLGLQFLLVGLAVTPLRRFAGINLVRFRRAIGLLAFYYISMHLLTWLVLDIRDPARIWADIVKRPYITVGMVGFVALVPLAVTSNNASVRKLRKRWRQLHWLVYPAVVLGAVHFVMLRKGWQVEPLVYLAIAAILLALRLRIPGRPGWFAANPAGDRRRIRG